MPELQEHEAQKFDLKKVEDEMDSRMDNVERITADVDTWDDIPEDREGSGDLPKMMRELNILGERRDDLLLSAGNEKQYTALRKVLKEPEKYLDTSSPKVAKGDFAQQFLASDYGKKMKDGARGGSAEFPLTSFGLKATLGEDAAQAGVDTDYPVRPDRIPGIVEELFQNPNISDLIPVITTGVDSIEYVTEDYTDAAVETDEAAAIAESSADFTLVTEAVRKIAVGIKATSEVLGDVGLMRGLVQLRLRQDIDRREDLQLLLGDGVAPNLDGIINRTGIGNNNYSLAAGVDDFLDAIFRAGTVIRQAFSNPTVAVMNAISWQGIRLAKDMNDNYFYGPPSDAGVQRIWGYAIVINENMEDNLVATEVPVLLGDWANSALIARNPNVSVGVTDSDASDFLADVLTFKASMREALIVHRASGFATVTVVA